WGILLIALGTLFLLDRLDFFDFQWRVLIRLWPLLLILWGVSILPVQNFLKIILALAVGALGVVMYGHQYENYKPHKSGFRYNFEKDEGRIRDTLVTQTFSHELEAGISSASLQLDATAGTYKLLGTTSELIRADKRGSSMAYNFRVEELGDNCKVIIEQVDNKIVLNSNKLNNFDLMLNPDVAWSFNLDVGAAELDFDLREFNIHEIEINGGAAAIDLQLGTESRNTKVNIDAAASAIKLVIPYEAGCRIKTASVLSSHNFKDFEKISRGVYETSGFENADQQIFIDLDAAVSSFKISRN
ncbi:MAG TPA: DUF5668 domain-containing protein, partial [Bacteroidales bacterium]|nr:DUF5668 domain-containing protein [Bacteroidales bacterium]